MATMTAAWELEDERPAPGAKVLTRSAAPRRDDPRRQDVRSEDVRSEDVRWAEVLDLDAELLADLPAPPLIVLRVPGVRGGVALALGGGSVEGRVSFDAGEWRAIVRGTSADRIWPRDFAALCHRKCTEPGWTIDEETALDGAQRDRDARWTARQVLGRIGAELESVELPAPADLAA